MSNIKIENSIPIIVETNGYEGVKRIAEAVARTAKYVKK